MTRDQRSLQSRCFHPSGTFIPFRAEETEQSLPARFEQIVRRYPDRIAVQAGSCRLSYDALNRGAHRLARAILDRLGEGTEPVALLFDHGPALLEAIWGILKAGKIYTPLDPSDPPARLRFILRDSQARLLVTSGQHLARIGDLLSGAVPALDVAAIDPGLPDGNLNVAIAPDSLASLYYTSGSTGEPKGVAETHRNRLVNAMRNTNALHLCAADRLALLYNGSFSGSVNSIYGALLNGATLLPFDLRTEGIGPLAGWLMREELSIYHSPPAVFRQLVGSLTGEETFPHLRALLLASNSLYQRDFELYRKHFSPDCLLLNSWGATESPFFRPYFIGRQSRIDGNNVPAAGCPTEEDELRILDDDGRPLPQGEAGEIALQSRYLSPGYWRQPELTHARFRPAPDGGEERLYLTGDVGRLLPDGCLVHLGRQDSQVKLRGLRVETAEIERALLDTGAFREAIVLSREIHEDDPRLVAYLVPASAPPPNVTTLRRTLAATLPDAMIPAAFVMLDAMPLTPARKVDLRALPLPARTRPNFDNPFVAAHSPLEQLLAALWGELLALDTVGIHDNFFELGGHSLLATQLLARTYSLFATEIPLATFFAAPTVAALAATLIQHEAEPGRAATIARLHQEIAAMSPSETRAMLATKRGARMVGKED